MTKQGIEFDQMCLILKHYLFDWHRKREFLFEPFFAIRTKQVCDSSCRTIQSIQCPQWTMDDFWNFQVIILKFFF
jgi:hypothetical protein